MRLQDIREFGQSPLQAVEGCANDPTSNLLSLSPPLLIWVCATFVLHHMVIDCPMMKGYEARTLHDLVHFHGSVWTFDEIDQHTIDEREQFEHDYVHQNNVLRNITHLQLIKLIRHYT